MELRCVDDPAGLAKRAAAGPSIRSKQRHADGAMIYRQLLLFLAPLAIIPFASEVGAQFLNGGMARIPNAVETLAAYGLAFGLTSFLSTPLHQCGQLGLVLTNDHYSRRRNQLFLLVLWAAVGALLLLIAVTPVGIWIIEDIHRVRASLSREVRFAMLCLVPLALLDAYVRYFAGLLLRYRQTTAVSAATLAKIGSSIAAVFVLLPLDPVQNRPILLPVAVAYIGAAAEAAVLFGAFFRHVFARLEEHTGAPYTLRQATRFYWPLVVVNAAWSASKPTMNLFIARGPAAEIALAAIVVAESLANMTCGWVNEMRVMVPAFREIPGSLRPIRRFFGSCGLLAFALMALLFWTPVRDVILGTLIALEPGVAAACRLPLFIYSFLPLTLMVRGYVYGRALAEHRTSALLPSALTRVLVNVAALLALPLWAIFGATMGAAAVLMSLTAETIVAWAVVAHGRPTSLPVMGDAGCGASS